MVVLGRWAVSYEQGTPVIQLVWLGFRMEGFSAEFRDSGFGLRRVECLLRARRRGPRSPRRESLRGWKGFNFEDGVHFEKGVKFQKGINFENSPRWPPANMYDA